MLVITNRTLSDRGIMPVLGEKSRIIMIPAMGSYVVPVELEDVVNAYLKTDLMKAMIDARIFSVGKREAPVAVPTKPTKIKPPEELAPLPEEGSPTASTVKQKSPRHIADVAV